MSPTITQILVALVAIIQILISIVEIFLWKNPKVHTRLDFDLTEAEKVHPIVMNAGLYNSFLAAGLLDKSFLDRFAMFLLSIYSI
jgi:putative membrane protein